MRYSYHSEQWLPYPVEQVFAFFANPENLPHLMPPWQSARIEQATFAPPPPRPVAADPALRLKTIAAGIGTRITISFRPFPFSPVRLPWEAEITEFLWNHHFSDLQLRGPFAYWTHCHSVRPQLRANESGIPTNGTLLRDDVEYEMPLAKLGELAQRTVIRTQIRNTFTYRRRRTRELLSSRI
jgi:ligand-binding SRPBCC domain-containing protein